MTKTIRIPKQLSRAGEMREETVAGKKAKRISISSDVPYKRYDWMAGEEYYEVLSHDPGDIDDSRLKLGLTALFNHVRDSHLARATGYNNDGHRLDVGTIDDLIWSESDFAQTKKRDVENGSLVGTSVGYAILDDGTPMGEKDGIPVYKFKWAPHEFSFCTIEADSTVGAGRQRSEPPTDDLQEIVISENIPLASLKNETTTSQQREIRTTEKPTMPEPTAPEIKVDVAAERNESMLAERKRVADIQNLYVHFRDNGIAGGQPIDTGDLAQTMIREGKTAGEFQTAVVTGHNFKAVKVVADDPNAGKVGMEDKDMERYSIVRAINCLAQKRGLDGVEKAAHDAHVKLTGRETEGIGFFIPQDILSFNRAGLSQQVRALFTNVYSAAGAFVNTDLLAGSLIELLRNKMGVVQMGARSLTGLVGNVAIPLQSGGATASWLSENATISESTQTVGQLGLTPHRLAGSTSFTYQLLAQSSVDVENFVREDLMRVLAIAKDLAAIAGTGASGQPLGILGTSNLSTSVTFANAQTMLYADALSFENNVALNNADLGKLGYMTTPTVRKNAKATAEIAAANSIPIWKNNMVNGFQAFATNQVPTATSVIFGNFDDLILASWAGMSVIVDPYSLSLQGQVRVVMQELCDNGLRHSKSFSVSTN